MKPIITPSPHPLSCVPCIHHHVHHRVRRRMPRLRGSSHALLWASLRESSQESLHLSLRPSCFRCASVVRLLLRLLCARRASIMHASLRRHAPFIASVVHPCCVVPIVASVIAHVVGRCVHRAPVIHPLCVRHCARCCVHHCARHYVHRASIVACRLDPPYLVNSQMDLANIKLCSLAA